METYCLQIFSKAPIAGFCKTRLAETIGVQKTVRVHESMINFTLGKFNLRDTDMDIQLWCKPDKSHPYFTKMAKQYSVKLLNQVGESLGEIMDYAAKQAFTDGYKSVIQIGTDCPDLDYEYLEKAINASIMHDIIIGPANDGGYVLLLLKKYQPGLYNNISWGTEDVLMQLIRNITSSDLSLHLIDTLYDVDTEADLVNYGVQA